MPHFDTHERTIVNQPLCVTATRDHNRWGGMSRVGLTSLLAVVTLCGAIAVSASPALGATAGPTHTRTPTTHRVGGKVHKAWPRTGGRGPRTALARWLARQ